jgi:hypothetical protein
VVEAIVKRIPQYRLYATSLLFLYDGATQDEIDSLDEESGIRYSPDVRVKIVDFAHAVTDLHAPDVVSAPFPPIHPKNADKGYLKGLASLKHYFKAYVPPHPTRAQAYIHLLSLFLELTGVGFGKKSVVRRTCWHT